MEIRKALELINSNLDNLTAELKNQNMSKPGTEDYGTTLRTEIYTTDKEGELPSTSSVVPNDQAQSPVKVINQEVHALPPQVHMIAANARNEMNIIQSNGGSQDIVSRQPKLMKYGSKKQILVDNEDPSARDEILPTQQSSQSPDRN